MDSPLLHFSIFSYSYSHFLNKHCGSVRAIPFELHHDLEIVTDRYHFLKPITIFLKEFSPIFCQLPIFNWPPILIFQNLLIDI